ncbi:MAG TPA: Si-specific NAD(P)(+) transhydrogenase [Acidimicrobiia bacterium]|nr:Si-specific NAD(P)(+) transhydrogenase [Acidimicrobiia bacterium]
MDQYDFVVIGSGPAGEKAAAQAAYFGKSVALVERSERLGGAPVNSGGIPAKTLRETALYLTGHTRRHLYGVGMELGTDVMLDRLRKRSAEESERAGATVRANLDRHGVTLVHGTGRLGTERVVEVVLNDGGTLALRGEAILVATGSHPFRPPNIPFDDPDVEDSDSILALDRIPESMVVIGGGPVGCEYSSIYGALGVEVTMVDMADRLMPFLDSDASEQLAICLEDLGIRVLVGSPPAGVERVDGTLTVTIGDETIEPGKVLFVAGRKGNTEGLGLEDAAIELDERGRVIVDTEYRTTAAGIFAAGDVIGPPALASVSAEQGRVAACHAFDIPFKEDVDELAPYGIYSIPEVGVVGMSSEQAAAAGIDAEIGRYDFSENPRSRIAGTTYGMIKLVFRRDDRKLLGVHIVGEEAAELVHIGQAVIHAGQTIDQFIDSTFNIPTRSEAYKYAAYDGLQRLSGHRPGD